MQLDFCYPLQHDCQAVMLCCQDFRFWGKNTEFVKLGLGIPDFDLVALPGAVKTVNQTTAKGDMALKALDISVRLHQAKTIVLINHCDCGAYGGSKNFAGLDAEKQFHEQELRQAKVKLQTLFPEKKIMIYYANLDNEQKIIDYQLVV